MRNCKSTRLLFALAILGLCLPDSVEASRIEAVKGKKYRLTKAHGPWMIMVASLKSIPGRRPTAEEGADQLVYELRKIGIPAYTYSQEAEIDEINTIDRFGRPRQRSYQAQEERVCVIAGNYPSVDDSVAQKTLEYIKQLHPKSWEDQHIYKKTPGRPGPLSGAFLTINPMLSPEEVMRRKDDPLLLKLNAGTDLSLLENPGKYSLVVASFYGDSITQIGASQRDLEIDEDLDQAAVDAWQLAKLLREKNFEAYVLHERYRSIVTVGSFDSLDDPRIPRGIEIFRAKIKTDPRTGQEILIAENIAVPGANGRPIKTWIFDPKPQVIEVPQLYRGR